MSLASFSAWEVWQADLDGGLTVSAVAYPADDGGWEAAPLGRESGVGELRRKGDTSRLAVLALAAELRWPIVALRAPGLAGPTYADLLSLLAEARLREEEARRRDERQRAEATRFYQANAEIGLSLVRALCELREARDAAAGYAEPPADDDVSRAHAAQGGFWLEVPATGEPRVLTAPPGATRPANYLWLNRLGTPTARPAARPAAREEDGEEEEGGPC